MGMSGRRGLVALALLLLGSLAEAKVFPNYPSTIGVPNGGFRGAWAWQEMCPRGTYATGFSLKVEPYQGAGRDDTGLNGVRILCSHGGGGDKHEAYSVESQSGQWGLWSEAAWCPPGGYLESFSLRVERVRSGLQDNMGATNLRFTCSGGETLEGHGLSWGQYGPWSPPCKKGLCGIQTRQQPPQGILGDDTALNDVRFLCCSR